MHSKVVYENNIGNSIYLALKMVYFLKIYTSDNIMLKNYKTMKRMLKSFHFIPIFN